MKKLKRMMGSSSGSVSCSEYSSIERVYPTDLTEDLWYEIFLHLPLESIYKFRCVSKQVWFSTLSNTNFINHWYKLNYLSPPWVLVHFATGHSQDNKTIRYFRIVYPDSHSQFVSHHQAGFSLGFLNPVFSNSNNNDKEQTRLFLIGSSNGLVLCRLWIPETYYVSNPLTKKWVSLPPPPPPPRGEDNWAVTGLICNECFSESTSYKVIRIPRFKDAAKEFEVDVFSSELGEWNICSVSCPQDVTWANLFVYDNTFSHNGVFYWFQKENHNIVAFSVNETTNGDGYDIECRLINLPDLGGDRTSHCIGESEGLICYARIRDTDRSLSVWVLEEDWHLLHKDIKFNDVLAEMQSWLIGEAPTDDLIKKIQVLGIDPTDKTVVILNYQEYILAYNTCTRKYEKLFYPSWLSSNLPYVSSALVFALKPRPTVLPSASWSGTSILDAQI